MNEEEVSALKEQTQLKYSCECTNSKNKPVASTCILCGKCYHAACALKIKNGYHIKGNLICCCNLQPKYIEQEVKSLKKDQRVEKKLLDSCKRENEALIEDFNNLHKRVNDNEELNETKLQLKLSEQKISDLTSEIFKLNDIIKNLNQEKDQICKHHPELEELKTINEKLNIKIKNLEQENKKFITELSKSQMNQNDENIEILKKEIKKLKTENLKKYDNFDMRQIYNDENCSEKNMHFLFRGNALLYNLNKEMQEKNTLMKENLDLWKEKYKNKLDEINVNNINNRKTYSAALKNADTTSDDSGKKDNDNHINNSDLIIKFLDDIDSTKEYSEKLTDLKKNLNLNELDIKITYTKHIKNGNVIINCDEASKKNIAEQLLKHKSK